MHKKWSFSLRISSVNATKSTFTEEILNGLFIIWKRFQIRVLGKPYCFKQHLSLVRLEIHHLECVSLGGFICITVSSKKYFRTVKNMKTINFQRVNKTNFWNLLTQISHLRRNLIQIYLKWTTKKSVLISAFLTSFNTEAFAQSL